MRTLFAIVLGAGSLGLSGFAVAADDKDDFAKKIVGKWEITKSEAEAPVGAVIEFTKDGKFNISVKLDGKDVKLDGTYKVDKDKLTTEVSIAGKAEKDVDTIKKLTDEEMEIENKDKKVITLKKKK
jgi:uncharacterized protein (TIGR03066 family)